MILLDTNVISEQMSVRPSQEVAAWFEHNSNYRLVLSSITEAELRRGVAIMPTGKPKIAKSALLNDILEIKFANDILSFDGNAAAHYAEIFARRKTIGRPISIFDNMIAAIARANDCRLATRNVEDFEHCGVEIINPWEYNN